MIKKFKFIDLFAGIGGFHIAMSNLGGECVFASEIDPYARKTYLHNFDINQKDFNQDITKMNIMRTNLFSSIKKQSSYKLFTKKKILVALFVVVGFFFNLIIPINSQT